MAKGPARRRIPDYLHRISGICIILAPFFLFRSKPIPDTTTDPPRLRSSLRSSLNRIERFGLPTISFSYLRALLWCQILSIKDSQPVWIATVNVQIRRDRSSRSEEYTQLKFHSSPLLSLISPPDDWGNRATLFVDVGKYEGTKYPGRFYSNVFAPYSLLQVKSSHSFALSRYALLRLRRPFFKVS